MPFESKAQQRFMYSQHPKIAEEFAKKTNFDKLPEKKETQEMMPKLPNEWAKKTENLSPEKRKEYQDAEASSSAAGGALTKENIPKAMHQPELQEVFMNVKQDVKPIRGELETAIVEDDTLMGRLAKRMASRDYIDELNLGTGTKAQKSGKAAMADNFADMDVIADKDIPRKKVIAGPAKLVEEGEKVEEEHKDTIKKVADGKTSPDEAPEEIAKDHLKEMGKGYYPALKKMEDGLKKNVNNETSKKVEEVQENNVIPVLSSPEKGFGLHNQTVDVTATNPSDPISSTKIGNALLPGRNMYEQAKLAGNKFIMD